MLQRIAVITTVLAIAACAQTAVLPTYVGAGAAFNQIGDPRTNIWATAIYPVVSSVGIYTSTTTDIVPLQKLDPMTKRLYWAFSPSIRQGVHKVLFTRGKLTLLLGGDAGVGMSQADPSGINVSFAGSFTATGIYQLSKSLFIGVPIRGMYVNGSWNLIPEIGVLFKP